MSEDQVPPPSPPPPPEQPPPPGTPTAPPPPPAAGPPPPADGVSPNRALMIVLSYLGIFALIPLLLETDDREVQWHAKHGLVLFGAEVVVFIVLGILMNVPVVGCAIFVVVWLFALAVFGFHIFLMVKGVNGERVTVPYVSEYADKF